MRRICGGMVAENSAIWRVGGVFLQHRLDVVDEAHAQHLVGLVEHQAAQLATGPACRGSRWSMTRPGVPTTTCTPRLQRTELRRIALAAVDRQHVEAGQVGGVLLEGLGDLDREFARRRQHQRLRLASAPDRCAPGSAARTRRSCRCRSAPGRARRGLRAAAGWWRPGSARATRSRRRPARAAAARTARDRRNAGREGIRRSWRAFGCRFRPVEAPQFTCR